MSLLNAEQEQSIFSDAKTVAIVVHGIGDHTSWNVLASVREGFRATYTVGSSEDVSLLNFPQPDGTNGPQDGIKIVESGRVHFVLPVIWSDLRMRASRAFPAAFTNFGDIVRALGRATVPMLTSCIDIARCLLKARSLAWRFGFALLALFMFSLTIAFLAIAMWLLIWIGWHMYGHTGAQPLPWYDAVLIVLLLVAVYYGVKRTLPLFDFVADVAAYVARARRTVEHEKALARIVGEVCLRAPHARILLIGHSLRSVLVSHSLYRMTFAPDDRQQLILVTLGSPLRRMSHIFPNAVYTPDKIARDLEGDPNILAWANLWRDRDVIGRDLNPDPVSEVLETSLGDGIHWNMWTDKRLWCAVTELLQLKDRAEIVDLKASWDMRRPISWPENRAEVYAKVLTLRRRLLFLVPVSFVSVAVLAYWGPGGHWFQSYRPEVLPFIWTYWLCMFALAYALPYASSIPHDSVQYRDDGEPHFSKDFLGKLRRAKSTSDSVLYTLIGLIWLYPLILLSAT